MDVGVRQELCRTGKSEGLCFEMNKRSVWKIIFILSVAGCVCCAGFFGWYTYQNWQTQKEYEALQAETESREGAQEDTPTLEEIENAEFVGELDGEAAEIKDSFFVDMENPINFEELAGINADIYAWIRIPDTKIDYPIAQRAGDDSYYLSHDMYQEPRFAGCIYTEDCNSKDFMDPNTVIYGHNMKNQTMFQNLHLFSDTDFFNKHPDVYIYTPDGVLRYKVFAAYTYDNRHIMNSFDFNDPEVFQQYIDDIFSVRSMSANIRDDVEVTADDHIITLATCIGGQTNSRYLVQAVLIKGGS